MRNAFHRFAGKLAALIIAVLLATSLWQLASAGWIQAKAVLAQRLLLQSWQRSLQDGGIHKPWSWADTWPVAMLEIPSRNIRQVVLAGDSGSTLAFAPGLSFAGTPAGVLTEATTDNTGTTLISGHRDTHFRFLQTLQTGDLILLHTPAGTRHYRVNSMKIIDSRNFRLSAEHDRLLVLSTCYPFDAIDTGGPLRYLVLASLTN